MVLVVADNAAPRHPVHVTLAARRFAFRFQRANGRRCRQTIQWHVHERGASTGRSGARRRPEPFPFRSSGFVDVNVGIHQPRQNGGLAKIRNGDLRRQLVRSDNIDNSFVLDEHSHGSDAKRRHHPS